MEAVTISNEDVMVSNLPLLFVDGVPTSIDYMTTEDLQYFLTFLMKCILGENTVPSMWSKFPRPKWWLKDVPWSSIILSKKYQTLKWQKKLQDLVSSCYNFYNCSVLLQFSCNLSQGIQKGWTYRYTDNWDGTTSMYLSPSGKLLVTFRNENMSYDRGLRQSSSGSSRPMLLPKLNPPSPTKVSNPSAVTGDADPAAAASSERMVEPPICDIFLCDLCGSSFPSTAAIKEHETGCCGLVAEPACDARYPEVDESALDQAKYMWYLGLSGKEQYVPPACLSPVKVSPVTGKTCNVNQRRYTAIPFSSGLGQSLLKSSNQDLSLTSGQVEQHEGYCNAKPLNGRVPARLGLSCPSGDVSQWQVTYRKVPVQKRLEEWTHLYSFNRCDRQERMLTITTGLTKRSRSLKAQCRPCRIVVTRLTEEEIQYWLKPKPKVQSQPQAAQSPALLQPLPPPPPQSALFFNHPWHGHFLPTLPANCTISVAPSVSNPQHASPLSGVLQPPLVIRQVPVPKVVYAASKTTQPTRPRPARSPPPLLPLVTNVWSLQSPPKKKPQVLPDLIPVSSSSLVQQQLLQARQGMALKGSGFGSSTQQTADQRKKIIIPVETPVGRRQRQQNALLADEEHELPLTPLPFSLPPGISITKIIRRESSSPGNGHKAQQSPQPQQQMQQHKQAKEKNNNFVTVAETQIAEVSVSPLLRFIEKSTGSTKAAATIATATAATYATASPIEQQQLKSDGQIVKPNFLTRQVPPLIRPFKVNTLPPEKREQMKQSLLKIQRQEAKKKHSPGSKDDNDLVDEQHYAVLEINVAESEMDYPKKTETPDHARRLSLSALSPNLPKDLKDLLLDECRELRCRGLDDLLVSDQRVTRRKTARMSSSISARIPAETSVSIADIPAETKEPEADDEGPTIIEVDISREIDYSDEKTIDSPPIIDQQKEANVSIDNKSEDANQSITKQPEDVNQSIDSQSISLNESIGNQSTDLNRSIKNRRKVNRSTEKPKTVRRSINNRSKTNRSKMSQPIDSPTKDTNQSIENQSEEVDRSIIDEPKINNRSKTNRSKTSRSKLNQSIENPTKDTNKSIENQSEEVDRMVKDEPKINNRSKTNRSKLKQSIENQTKDINQSTENQSEEVDRSIKDEPKNEFQSVEAVPVDQNQSIDNSATEEFISVDMGLCEEAEESNKMQDSNSLNLSSSLDESQPPDQTVQPGSQSKDPLPELPETPSAIKRRKWRIRELSRLHADECKELKRNGLDVLSKSEERVTRRRTKSTSGSSPVPPSPAPAKKKIKKE